MPATKVEQQVKNIIVDELGVDAREVTPTARIIEDLGADSLDAFEITTTVEEQFGIEIPEDDAVKLVRVSDLVNYVDMRTAG